MQKHKKKPQNHIQTFCGSLVGCGPSISFKIAWNKILFYILLIQNLFYVTYVSEENTYHTKYLKKVKMHILADANICIACSKKSTDYREVEITS